MTFIQHFGDALNLVPRPVPPPKVEPEVDGTALSGRIISLFHLCARWQALAWLGVRRRHVSGRRGIASVGAIRSVARPPSIRQSKDWILVAAFDGPADDSTLAGATRDLVCAALDESEIVSPVSDGQMRIALERAGKPRNTRVDATQPLIDLATPSFEAYRRPRRAVELFASGNQNRALAVAREALEYKPVKRLFVHSSGGRSVSARRL